MHTVRLLARRATYVAVVAVLLACTRERTSSAPAAAETTFARVNRTKVLRVGYVIYPPAVQRDPATGKMSGHFVRAVEELARQMNARVEYREATWATFAAGLQTNQYDLSIAPTFRTVPRAMAVAFTRPLFYVGNSAIARRGETRFRTVDDLARTAGLRIAVTQGEAGHEYATRNLKSARLTVIASADQSLAFGEVAAGRADVALGDAWAAAQYARAHGDVVDLFATEPYNLTSVGWAARVGDTDFLQFLNVAIDLFEDTGQLREWELEVDAPWYHRVAPLQRYSRPSTTAITPTKG